MSLPSMHMAVGMSFPFMIWAVVFSFVRRVTSGMLLLLVFFMGLCAAWSEVPDMIRYMPKQYHVVEHREITRSKYGNVFFFHRFLDRYQTEDRGLVEGTSAILFMLFFILFASRRSFIENEKQIYKIQKKFVAKKQSSFKKIDNAVDIHSHVLPGVDDGAKNIQESILMCRRAFDLGIKTIVATPHMPWAGQYQSAKVIEAYNALKTKLKDENIGIDLCLGSEIKISPDLIGMLNRKVVFSIEASRYFLFELDSYTVPSGLENFIGMCNKAGFCPIMSHPERNLIFQKDFGALERLLKLDVLLQITYESLLADAQKTQKRLAVDLLKNDMVSLIATDAHSCDVRMNDFQEGVSALVEIVGEEKLNELVVKNPMAVINDVGLR